MNQDSIKYFVVGVISALIAYSFYPYLWSEEGFFQLTALSFTCYLRALYLNTTGRWSLVVFIVWLSTLDSLLDELFFDPQTIGVHEYVSFTIIILLSIKYKTKWTR